MRGKRPWARRTVREVWEECPYPLQMCCLLPPLQWMGPGLWTLGEQVEEPLRKEVYPFRRIHWKPSVKANERPHLTLVPRLREGCQEQVDPDLSLVDRVR